jgi:hypothetical protein
MYRILLFQVSIFLLLTFSACNFNNEKSLNNERSAEKQSVKSPFLRLSTNQEGAPSNDQLAAKQINQLPFENFSERWNAFAEETGSGLKISNFKEITSETESFFQSSLHNQLELRVFVENETVQKIQLVGHGKTKADMLLMLTGWNQIYSMMNTDYETYEVDLLFNDLGVGPNADLESVQQKTMTYRNITYTVTPINSGFLFEASYPQP